MIASPPASSTVWHACSGQMLGGLRSRLETRGLLQAPPGSLATRPEGRRGGQIGSGSTFWGLEGRQALGCMEKVGI